jgi:hypothetical protein
MSSRSSPILTELLLFLVLSRKVLGKCLEIDQKHYFPQPQYLITGSKMDRPLGFQEVGALRFLDNRHMKAVRLSALRTDRLYTPGNIPVTHFC